MDLFEFEAILVYIASCRTARVIQGDAVSKEQAGKQAQHSLFVCLFVCLFRDRVSLCSPGCPGTHSADQAGLKLRNPLASASQVLGLKASPPLLGKMFSY